MKTVQELPNSINNNSTYIISDKKINYFTHNFFKYPCKFIPHIPRWAIKKYTKEKN